MIRDEIKSAFSHAELIRIEGTEPGLNLALEETLLTNAAGEYVLVWRNSPSVIIGRNQNAYAEVNTDFADSHGIKTVRRMTGGGAVYHDLGNVNFSFIGSGAREPDFRPYLEPIASCLKELGLDASVSGRNDILVDGFKVSGSAKAVSGGRTLVHGTLMFDVDRDVLGKVLRPDKLKLESKGIRSVRSRVKNISEFGGIDMTVDDFTDRLCGYLRGCFDCRVVSPAKEHLIAAGALAEKKYLSRQWNYGASPRFELERSARFPSGTVTVACSVSEGVIRAIGIYGDFFGERDISELEKKLTGLPFSPRGISDAIGKDELKQFIGTDDIEAFSRLFA